MFSFIIYLNAFARNWNYLFFIFVLRKNTHYRVISSHTSLLNITCKITTAFCIENYLCLAQLVVFHWGFLLNTVCTIAKFFNFTFEPNCFICVLWTRRTKNLAAINSTNWIISEWQVCWNHRIQIAWLLTNHHRVWMQIEIIKTFLIHFFLQKLISVSCELICKCSNLVIFWRTYRMNTILRVYWRVMVCKSKLFLKHLLSKSQLYIFGSMQNHLLELLSRVLRCIRITLVLCNHFNVLLFEMLVFFVIGVGAAMVTLL